MSVELSKKQIDWLFLYVRGKNVTYLDLQHELVDHFATAIEEDMMDDSIISFRSSLRNVASRFPDSEFDQFVKNKRKEIHKYCLLYTSPSPRDATLSRMPSSA